MKRIFGFILLGLLAASVLSVNTASTGYAQAPTEEQKQQWLLQENIEKFEEWRRSIPDYEKRLYDRVKAVNKRVIRVQNLVIASFFLLLIINYIFLIAIYRRIGRRTGTSSPSDPAAETSEDGAPSTTPCAVEKDSGTGISHFFLNKVPVLLEPVTSRIGKYLPQVVEAPARPSSSSDEFRPVTPFRSFQDRVLRGLSATEYSRAYEIRLFFIWLIVFALTSLLLLVIKPHQMMYGMDQFQYYQQILSQVANGNPLFGMGGNYLVYGGIDFAVNGHLLPAFYFASFFSDLSAPITTYAILSIELFAAMYVSCRMFQLPVHVAMIAAWLAPLFFIPYTYPSIVVVEPLLVTPFLYTMACLTMLSVALFYRLGKSGFRNTLAISCGLFLIPSYVTLSLLYFSIIYSYAVVWPCLAIFIFASSMKERVIKAVSVIVLAGLYYVFFFDYLEAFYTHNWGSMLPGQGSAGADMLNSVFRTFVTAFTSFDKFFEVFTIKVFPMWSNQRSEFSFTTVFLYGSVFSGFVCAALFANRYKSNIFQLSVTFLTAMLGPVLWHFGNFEAAIAPLFLISFVLGIVVIAQILGYLATRWLTAMGAPARLIENGIMFVKRLGSSGRAATGGVILDIRGVAFFLIGGAFLTFFLFRFNHGPVSRMYYEYGARPDLDSYRILERDIGINRSPLFRGRLVSQAFIEEPDHYGLDPWDPASGQILRDILNLRRKAEFVIASKYGGDFLRTVNQDRIPALFDNNRFTGPGIAALERYLLNGPKDRVIVQNHNISLFDRRLLEMLGVRFVLRSEPLSDEQGVVLRTTEKIDRNLTLYLYELPGANTGTFSPTSQVVFSSAKQALDLIGDPALDFKKTALVLRKVPGPLVPARHAEVKIVGNSLSVEAESDGKSLVVLPFEFSHCLSLENRLRANAPYPGRRGAPAPLPELIRVNLDQTGLAFERAAKVTIRFRLTPFNAACRKQDLDDWEILKITELRTYKGLKWSGGFVMK